MEPADGCSCTNTCNRPDTSGDQCIPGPGGFLPCRTLDSMTEVSRGSHPGWCQCHTRENCRGFRGCPHGPLGPRTQPRGPWVPEPHDLWEGFASWQAISGSQRKSTELDEHVWASVIVNQYTEALVRIRLCGLSNTQSSSKVHIVLHFRDRKVRLRNVED